MAHAVLATATHALTGDRRTAIAEARAAHTLNPNNALAMSVLGIPSGYDGNHEEGIGYLRRAIRASPHDPLTWA